MLKKSYLCCEGFELMPHPHRPRQTRLPFELTYC